MLAMITSPVVAAATGSYRVEAEISYGGKTYTVTTAPLPPEEQRELALIPASPLKAYSQASLMSSESALLNFQVYETRGGRMSQLTALTLLLNVGREHTEVMDTPYGKLNLRVKLDVSNQPAAASSSRAPNYAPVAPPKVTGTIPDEQRSVPKPISR